MGGQGKVAVAQYNVRAANTTGLIQKIVKAVSV
jgi:hypothetical protein